MSGEDEEVVERANARIGTLLMGKYTIDRVLGIGGMATVYAATHRNGKEFAVKILHPELSMRSETRTRFLREGYLANRVNHPGAVAVLDDDVGEDGDAFLVMELLDGQTLESLWERNGSRLPLQLVVGIGIQLLDVLAAAHARGLVHRDIKPGNLMVTRDGLLKVLDFGIARLKDVANARMTQTGVAMGTPAFMAPEQALAKTDEIDAQTDLWAVAATLFTLASGELVHTGENAQRLLINAATVPARGLATVSPKAPQPFCAVIDRALAFEKAQRWPNAVAMGQALKVASGELFPAVPTPEIIVKLIDGLEDLEKTSVEHVQPPYALSLTNSSHPGLPIRKSPAIGMGAVTAAAVATDSVVRRTAPKSRGRLVAGAIVVAAVGVGGLLLATMRGTPADSKLAGTGALASPAAVVPVLPASARLPAAPSETSTWTAVPPTASAPPPASTMTSDALKSAPPLPLSTKRVVLPAPAPPSSAKPRCDPPYEFDEKGDKRWKRECL
jgi:serine/threonine protein kinase